MEVQQGALVSLFPKQLVLMFVSVSALKPEAPAQ